ncbi:MAG: FAD-dependent oxidoreductase [Candidatus Bipolaricaulia bacterium]
MPDVVPSESPSADVTPTLTDEQIEQLRPYGTEESVSTGDVLIEEGERGADFFLLLEGEVEVFRRRAGEKTESRRGGRGQFGLLDTLDERPAGGTVVVREPGRVLRLTPDCLRRVVAETADLGNLILRTFLARHALSLTEEHAGIQIVGSRFSEATHRIKGFASRNDIPYTWLDPDRDEGAERVLSRFDVPPAETPIVIVRGEEVLRQPSNAELARAVGIAPPSLPGETVDLIVVGGGPAGLAASVYGASEGLSTICLEAEAVGGRAGTTSKIENYLGFPTGLSGQELARRARLQARKFGARIAVPERADALHRADGHYVVELAGDDETAKSGRLRGRSVLLATGAEYRRLPLDRLEEFEGSGIYYAARGMQAQICEGKNAVVVGGGNSAGQAALFLSDEAETVHMLLRGGDLTKSMSRYLVDRVRKAEDVTVHLHTEAVELHGDDHLTAVTTENNRDGTRTQIDTPALFSFIGATPCTGWLRDADDSPAPVALDENGFVLTGTALPTGAGRDDHAPAFLETNQPGVFAAGDVRSGSVKRVASAVGEGSMAVKLVHESLARIPQ